MIEGLNQQEWLHCSTLFDTDSVNPIIKVIGIGGCGLNAIDYMIEKGISEFEYLAIDTDEQALAHCLAGSKLQIGDWISKSMETDATPAIKTSAEQDSERIKALIGDDGAGMVFIVMGLGRRTGTHVAPLVAKIAQPMGPLILAAAVMPQNNGRIDYEDANLKLLSDNVHSLIAVPDTRSTEMHGHSQADADNTGFLLCRAVTGMAQAFRNEGLMPCDFLDACIIIQGAGMCLIPCLTGKPQNSPILHVGNFYNID